MSDSLPLDPSHPYYLTSCFACSAKAKPNQEFIRNYGGVVCFSCRAFFRRVYQKPIQPSFVCKRGGNCNVVVLNHRKCQRCRLDRCLQTGMNRAAILTDEQKQQRFRKMLQKRQTQSCQTGQSSRIEDVEMVEVHPEPPPGSSTYLGTSKDTAEKFLDRLTILFNSKVAPEASKFLFSNTKSDNSLSGRCAKLLTGKVQKIVQAYKNTIGGMNCKLLSKLNLLSTKEDPKVTINRTDFTSYILLLTEQYKKFSEQLRSFNRLDPADQSVLFSRNNPLFIQYQITVSVILPLEKSLLFAKGEFSGSQTKKTWLRNYLLNLFLENLNLMSKIFKSDCDLEIYGRLIRVIRHHCLAKTIEEEAVLAYLLLMTYNNSTNLRYPQDLDELNLECNLLFNSFIKPRHPACFSFDLLTTNLTKMALFCSYHLNWEEQDFVDKSSQTQSPSCLSLVIPYTDVEETWLERQLIQMDEAYRSVVIGGDFVDNFALHSMGKPTPRTFFPEYLSAVLERLWRTLMIHQEFQELPPNTKLQIMQSNCYNGMAMNTVRGESSTGLQQIQNGFGELDEQVWNDKYASLIKCADQVKSHSICQSPFLTDEEKRDYKELLQNSSILNQDPVLFRLNILLSMTRANSQTPKSLTEKVHNRYAILMKRRLSHLQANGNGPFAKLGLTANEAFSAIMSGHKNLTHIAKYLLQVFEKARVKVPSYQTRALETEENFRLKIEDMDH